MPILWLCIAFLSRESSWPNVKNAFVSTFFFFFKCLISCSVVHHLHSSQTYCRYRFQFPITYTPERCTNYISYVKKNKPNDRHVRSFANIWLETASHPSHRAGLCFLYPINCTKTTLIAENGLFDHSIYLYIIVGRSSILYIFFPGAFFCSALGHIMIFTVHILCNM